MFVLGRDTFQLPIGSGLIAFLPAAKLSRSISCYQPANLTEGNYLLPTVKFAQIGPSKMAPTKFKRGQ